MTPLPDPTPGLVHDALYSLTQHRNGVAAALRAKGCRGQRGNANNDPVTKFLETKFRGTFQVSAGAVEWGSGKLCACPLPREVDEFVKAFDRGDYLELVL